MITNGQKKKAKDYLKTFDINDVLVKKILRAVSDGNNIADIFTCKMETSYRTFNAKSYRSNNASDILWCGSQYN